MAYSISLDNLNIYVNYYNALKKAGLNFDIEQTSEYVVSPNGGGNYEVRLNPIFTTLTDIFGISKIWTAGRCPVRLSNIQEFPGMQKLNEGKIKENAAFVSVANYRDPLGTVKFYAGSVLDKIPGLRMAVINGTPTEMSNAGHTYRLCLTSGGRYTGEVVYFANEEDALYNYIDPGRIIISRASPAIPVAQTFVTDMLTLDMNYIVAMFSVYPEGVMEVLQNKAFLPSKDSRMTLLKLEKKLPAKYQAQYQALKTAIQEDFSKNTSNVMIGKLTRNESPFIDINNIRITKNTATYTAGNVSIEASNLSEVIFKKLNPNEEWDIFTLISIYTDWMEAQFVGLPLNDAETGFQEEFSLSLKINTMPIKVSVSTKNTRRSINGHLINMDELSPCIKRASCYLVDEENDNKKDYDRFLANVSRHSLKIRDIWVNGLPVKTTFLDSDRHSHNSEATNKHPKLRFIQKDKKGFYLIVNTYDTKDKKKTEPLTTSEYRIGKFAEFIKKVQQANRHTYMGYEGNYQRTHEGGWEPRAGGMNTLATKLCELLKVYAEGITEADLKQIVGSVNFELSEAEKRSEEMLKKACEMTKAKSGERDGKKGYVVPGKLRTYFVEEDSLRVYDADPKSTNPYFCVVNKGEQGVGRDALVSRLFALSNDQMLVKQITTLKR